MTEATNNRDVQRHEAPLVVGLLRRLVRDAMQGHSTEGGAWLSPLAEENENRVVSVDDYDRLNAFVVATDTGMRYAVRVVALTAGGAVCGHADYQGGYCADMACSNYYGSGGRRREVRRLADLPEGELPMSEPDVDWDRYDGSGGRLRQDRAPGFDAEGKRLYASKCPCECNSGGSCGGCGHAGCGRRA